MFRVQVLRAVVQAREVPVELVAAVESWIGLLLMLLRRQVVLVDDADALATKKEENERETEERPTRVTMMREIQQGRRECEVDEGLVT